MWTHCPQKEMRYSQAAPNTFTGCLPISLSLFSPHSLWGLTPHISPTLLGLSLALLLHPGLPLSPSWWPQAVKCYNISGLGSLSGPKFFSSPCKTLRKKECSFIMFYFSIFFLQPPLDDIFAQPAINLKCPFLTCPRRCGISPEKVGIWSLGCCIWWEIV